MNKADSQNIGQIPEIYAAISVYFQESTELAPIINELERIGINEVKIRKPKHSASVSLDFAIIKYEQFWELDEALSKMFLYVENSLQELKDVVQKYHGEIYIDIAFYQYGKCPSLVFNGDNMEKIHLLQANISIDPY